MKRCFGWGCLLAARSRSRLSAVRRGLRGKGASGQAAPLHWSGLRFAAAALRCSVTWPRRQTRCVRCAQTVSTNQKTIALRAGPRALRFSAPQRRCATCPDAPLLQQRLFSWRTPRTLQRGRRCPAGAISVAARSGGSRLARASALRHLTRRGCLSAVSEAHVASSAARPRTEHRSGVDAQHRSPQHEPLPGAACRDAQLFRAMGTT